jgi:hypothetical protein
MGPHDPFGRTVASSSHPRAASHGLAHHPTETDSQAGPDDLFPSRSGCRPISRVPGPARSAQAEFARLWRDSAPGRRISWSISPPDLGTEAFWCPAALALRASAGLDLRGRILDRIPRQAFHGLPSLRSASCGASLRISPLPAPANPSGSLWALGVAEADRPLGERIVRRLRAAVDPARRRSSAGLLE